MNKALSKIYIRIYVATFILSVIVAILYRQNFVLNTLKFFVSIDGDFLTSSKFVIDGFDEYMGHPYPPFANLIFKHLGFLLGYSNSAFQKNFLYYFVAIIYNLLPAALLFCLIEKLAKANGKTIQPLLSLLLIFQAPYLSAVRTSNYSVWPMVLALAFFVLYDSQDKILKEIGIICLSIACGIKVTPAVFGLYLLYRKDYTSIVKLIIYSAVLFFVPLIFLYDKYDYIGRIKFFIVCTLKYSHLFHKDRTGGLKTLYQILFRIDKYFGLNLDMRHFVSILSKLLFLFLAVISSAFAQNRKLLISILCLMQILFSSPTYHSYTILMIPILYFLIDGFDNSYEKALFIVLCLIQLAPFIFFFATSWDILIYNYLMIDMLLNTAIALMIIMAFKKNPVKIK